MMKIFSILVYTCVWGGQPGSYLLPMKKASDASKCCYYTFNSATVDLKCNSPSVCLYSPSDVSISVYLGSSPGIDTSDQKKKSPSPPTCKPDASGTCLVNLRSHELSSCHLENKMVTRRWIWACLIHLSITFREMQHFVLGASCIIESEVLFMSSRSRTALNVSKLLERCVVVGLISTLAKILIDYLGKWPGTYIF